MCFFLTLFSGHVVFIDDFIMLSIDCCYNLLFKELLRPDRTYFWCSKTCSNYSEYVTWNSYGTNIFTSCLFFFFNMLLKALDLVFMFLLRLRLPKNLSLIQVIYKRYGNSALKLVRRFEKLDFKHRNVTLDLQF